MPAPAIARANAQITQTRTERGAKSQGNSRTRRERTLFVADAVRDAAKMLLADLANEGARENGARRAPALRSADDVELGTERRAGAIVAEFVKTIKDPVMKEAVALQGFEEARHAKLIRVMIERYGIDAAERPLEDVSDNIETRFKDFDIHVGWL